MCMYTYIYVCILYMEKKCICERFYKVRARKLWRTFLSVTLFRRNRIGSFATDITGLHFGQHPPGRTSPRTHTSRDPIAAGSKASDFSFQLFAFTSNNSAGNDGKTAAPPHTRFHQVVVRLMTDADTRSFCIQISSIFLLYCCSKYLQLFEIKIYKTLQINKNLNLLI